MARTSKKQVKEKSNAQPVRLLRPVYQKLVKINGTQATNAGKRFSLSETVDTLCDAWLNEWKHRGEV